MSLTQEELIGFRQKRREAFLKVFSIFISLTAAAIMVFFVIRLVSRRVESDRKAQLSMEAEREHFEANVSSTRQSDDPLAPPRPPPREIIPNTDVVDMSVSSPPPRIERILNDPRAQNPQESAAIPKTIENIDQKQAAIAQVLQEFFSARSITKMLPMVRDGRRVRPLMEEFYERYPIKERTWKGIGWAIPVEEPGYRFAYVQATFSDSAPLNVVVEETSSGFLVDWESSVQYSEISWKEFMTSRPSKPRSFRVIASRADGATGRGTVLSLRHPFEEGVLLGRFDQTDGRFRHLIEQLDLCKWKDAPVILRLYYSGISTEATEVQIAGVEGKGWLILGERTR